MPIVSTIKMTADQFLQLGEDPPGVRLELVDGEVAVSPSPSPDHSAVVVNLIIAIGTYVRANSLGELHHDVDTILNTFTVRRPDLLFYTNERTHLIGKKAMEGPPDLAVEVISPSSIEIDRTDKFGEYREGKVPNYWIVDSEPRTIEGWTLKRGRYVRSGRGQGTATVRLSPFAGLDIPLRTLWRPVRPGTR
jgi:Uma2 family endonuclease